MPKGTVQRLYLFELLKLVIIHIRMDLAEHPNEGVHFRIVHHGTRVLTSAIYTYISCISPCALKSKPSSSKVYFVPNRREMHFLQMLNLITIPIGSRDNGETL